jgi:hypothetical protein
MLQRTCTTARGAGLSIEFCGLNTLESVKRRQLISKLRFRRFDHRVLTQDNFTSDNVRREDKNDPPVASVFRTLRHVILRN